MSLLSAFVVTGCSSTVNLQDRDRDSTYRGIWGATFLPTPSSFRSGNLRLNCWDMAGRGNLDIAGGRVVARVRGHDLGGVVDARGKFSAELSLKNSYKFILKGQLDASSGTGNGVLIHAREEWGERGCSSKVELKKG